MTWRRHGPAGLALLLALVAAGAALRAVLTSPGREAPAARAAFPAAEVARARALMDRLVRGLLDAQGPEGAFDPYPDDPTMPPVKRTGPHALAAAGLARARALGAGDPEGALARGLDRALDVLCSRQERTGTFGAMPTAPPDPWPGVEAVAAGAMALALAGRESDRSALRAAAAALERACAYQLRNGWTRALAAMSTEAIRGAGWGGLLPAGLVPPEADPARIDCGDYRLAEAIARQVARPGDALPPRVLEVCLSHEPRWTGPTADLPSGWMQAWLAARLPGGEAWFEAALPALEAAEASPPRGTVAGGWYGDAVTQTACALLVLAEGLEGRPRGP